MLKESLTLEDCLIFLFVCLIQFIRSKTQAKVIYGDRGQNHGCF